MTETELAWLSGIMDGEGSITVFRFQGRPYPRIYIGMTHKPTIDRIRVMF